MTGGNKVSSFPCCLHKEVWRVDAPRKSVRNARKGNPTRFHRLPAPIRASRSIRSSSHELDERVVPLQMATQTAYCHVPLCLSSSSSCCWCSLWTLEISQRVGNKAQGRAGGGGRKGWIGVHYATNLGTRPDASVPREREERETECATLTGRADSTQLQGVKQRLFLKKIVFMLRIIKKLQFTENHEGRKQ